MAGRAPEDPARRDLRSRHRCPTLVASVHESGRLALHIPNGTPFHKDQLEDRASMKLMERAASNVFGGRVRVRLEFGEATNGDTSAGSNGETGTGTTRVGNGSSGDGQARGGDDPIVRKVLEIFDGRVTTREREE